MIKLLVVFLIIIIGYMVMESYVKNNEGYSGKAEKPHYMYAPTDEPIWNTYNWGFYDPIRYNYGYYPYYHSLYNYLPYHYYYNF